MLIVGSKATDQNAIPVVIAGERPASRKTGDLRDLLRSATHDIHERLHRHPGLAAVQDGSIVSFDYCRLLERLYGFHIGFERSALIEPGRSGWLGRDLAALGINPERLAALPLCRGFPAMALPEALLGAQYVVEGSALGGVALARGLDGLLGVGVLDGRRFFTGHKSETGSAWRAYLLRLSTPSHTPDQQATIVSTASATFAVFERWLGGWNDTND